MATVDVLERQGCFREAARSLESEGIPYFVSGSFASSAHGIPRSTNDIDIVIAPSAQQLRALLAHLWWAKLGESERQINDAAGVIQVQGDHLDMDSLSVGLPRSSSTSSGGEPVSAPVDLC
jgi:hypothetical protein